MKRSETWDDGPVQTEPEGEAVSEWEKTLKDFSAGTCHDDCCQENAGLANAIDSALREEGKP